MRDLFVFILISNFSLEMFGPYSVSICSPLPRAAGLLAEGKFAPVLQVQRHQQSCSQSALLHRKTVTNKIEEVQEKVKKRARKLGSHIREELSFVPADGRFRT